MAKKLTVYDATKDELNGDEVDENMKAYTARDRNGDEGITLVVFAENAGKAKAYAARTDAFCEYGFTGIRVNRCPMLDKYYSGQPEMDWRNMKDRVVMVRYANFECSPEIAFKDCHCEECDARKWCGRYERMTEDYTWLRS